MRFFESVKHFTIQTLLSKSRGAFLKGFLKLRCTYCQLMIGVYFREINYFTIWLTTSANLLTPLVLELCRVEYVIVLQNF